MYVCICIYAYKYIPTYVHTHIHTHTQAYVYAYTYICIHVCIYVSFVFIFLFHTQAFTLSHSHADKILFYKGGVTLERAKSPRIKTLSIQIHACTTRINIRRCYQNLEYTHSYMHTFELKSKVRGKASFRDFGPSNAGHGKEWRSFAN